MSKNSICYEKKFFLVSFQFDQTWSCMKLEEFSTCKVQNIDKKNNTIEVRFQKNWYLGQIHSSSDTKENILRRGQRLSQLENFKDYVQSDTELYNNNLNVNKKRKIGKITLHMYHCICTNYFYI